MSQLDRRRLPDNFLDRQDAAAERIARQERTTATADGQGRAYATGLLLEVMTVAPDPPRDGYALLYVLDDGSDVKLMAMDADGAAIELGDWT